MGALRRSRSKSKSKPKSKPKSKAEPQTKEQSKLPKMAGGGVKARDVQVWLLFGSRMVQTIMRMALAPLVVYICNGIKCDAETKGTLLSAFSLGYLSTQIIGGSLADRLGPKALMLFAMIGAGFATLATPLGGSSNQVSGILFCQVIMGACQGPLFPTSIAYLSKWLPPDERSWASTMLDSGITVGSMIALPASGFLAKQFGWEFCFYLYGALTLLFATVWWLYAEADPEKCRYITMDELEYLRKVIGTGKDTGSEKASGSAAKAGEPSCSLANMLTHHAVWAIYISHIAFNFGVYFLNSWTPTYYKDELQVEPDEAVVAFMAPHVCNMLVKLVVAKPLFSYLHNTCGFSNIACRRIFTVVGFIGTALALLAVAFRPETMKHSSNFATMCFSVAMALVGLHPSGFKANYMDVTKFYSGVVSGVGNTVASVASYIGPLVVAFILKEYNNDWPLIFTGVAVCNVVAALVFGTLSTATPIDAGKLKAAT